jgi:hypothetical protein
MLFRQSVSESSTIWVILDLARRDISGIAENTRTVSPFGPCRGSIREVPGIGKRRVFRGGAQEVMKRRAHVVVPFLGKYVFLRIYEQYNIVLNCDDH